MNTNNIIAVVAVIAIAIAFVNLSVTLMSSQEFVKITGFGITRGSVNLTLMSFRDVNFSTWEVNFSYGSLNTGVSNATLHTTGTGTPDIARGNWSTSAPNAKALRLDNIGSSNSSISLQAGKTAATMWAGTPGERGYMWNVSAKAGSVCSNDTTSSELQNVFRDVNVTNPGKFCNTISPVTGQNSIYIDILLTIPYDTTATQTVGDTITATAGAPS